MLSSSFINRVRWLSNYNFSKKSNKASNCSGSSLAAYSIRRNCLSFNRTMLFSLSSRKNCETVIPKASHIFSRDEIEGNIFFRYQEEIVDWVSPDRSASWYSVQWRSVLNLVIFCRMSNSSPPILNILVHYTNGNTCKIIYFNVQLKR